MTDAQKIDALTDLLSDVIHSLEMTKYKIEDGFQAANVAREADHYHQQMLNIIHSETEMQINLTTEQFLILKDLINSAIEVDQAYLLEFQILDQKAANMAEERLTKALAAQAWFNSHGMTISETGTSCP